MTSGGGTWQSPGGSYRLPPDEVHVWRASLDRAQGHLASMMRLLSPEERKRADSFYFAADRQRCILARGVARMLLGHCLGSPASQVQFQYNEFGKPMLAGGLHPSLQFNLSHSGDLVLIALSRGRALGVDIERMREDLATKEIAGRFFSPEECRALDTVAADARREAFFACWTLKESYLKARGDGLSLPLAQFDVSFLPAEKIRLIATRHDPAEVHRWTLCGLEGGDGYKAALAVEGGNWRLKCWDWPTASVGDRGECSEAGAFRELAGPHGFLNSVNA